MGKLNSDMFWKPDLGIVGDSADFIGRLHAALPGYKADYAWAKDLKLREKEKEDKHVEKGQLDVDRYLNPLSILHKVEQKLSDNAILVADGAGFAIGAKAANPDAEIWIIYGDGSLGYSIIEYDTYRRFKMPVLSIVGNDACWTQIAREQYPMLGSNVGCMLEFSSYEKVAEALGAM